MTLLKNRPQEIAGHTGPPVVRLIAFALLIVTCWAVLFATAPAESAAPTLRSTSPGNQETDNFADRVELTFDRPVAAGLATVRIIGPSGTQVVSERPVHPGGRADTISVPMPKTRYGGTYAVVWTLPSAGLEPVGGTFAFNVFAATDPSGVPRTETAHDTAVAVAHTIARFAAVAALVVLTGAAFFVTAIWPAGARSAAMRRLIGYSWLGLVLATLAVLVTYGPYAAWAPLGDVFDLRLLAGTFESDAGATLLTRLSVLVPVTIGLAGLMTGAEPATVGERRARVGVVLGCAAALAATWSLPTYPTPLNLVADVVLMNAVAVPVGVLLVLAMFPDKDLSAVSRFSRVVVVCTGLLVVVGGYLGWRHGVDGGSHGWLLAGLLALVVLLAVTCGLIRRRLRVSGEYRVRGLAVIAAGMAVLILSATAILVVSQPPRTAHAQVPERLPMAIRLQAPPTRLELGSGDQDRMGALDVALVPASTGANGARIDIHLSLVGASGADDDATIDAVLDRPGRSTPTLPVSLRRAASGYSTGSVTLPAGGRWELVVTVLTGDRKPRKLTQIIDLD